MYIYYKDTDIGRLSCLCALHVDKETVRTLNNRNN